MRFAAVGLLLVSATSAAPKRAMTVDDLVSQHEPSSVSPVWSPDGSAFVFERSGEVLRFEAGAHEPKAWFLLSTLHPAKEKAATPAPFNWRNRHVSETSLQWFPDGKRLMVFSDSRLFIVQPDGTHKELPIEAAEDPQLAPDGLSVLYRSQQNLYVFGLANRHSGALTTDGSATLLNGELDWVYPEELELGSAAWWSPDSHKIAFLQFDIKDEFVYPQADLLHGRALAEPERYPQAGTPNARVRLGIVDAGGGAITWVKAGNSPDVLMARVAWLPDSSAVALETMPRVQNELSLLFCDPATGEVSSILHESSKDWINIADNLQFLSTRPEFLWTSERSGFRHIYRYSRVGELLGQITSGDWEVRSLAAVDEAGGRVFFTGTQDSPLETHLYAAPLAGGQRVRLTEPHFHHSLAVEPHGRMFVDRASNLTTAPRTTLRRTDGTPLALLQKGDSAAEDALEIPSGEILHLAASDGSPLYGRLIKPPGFKKGRQYPLIVALYGGPGAQSVHNEYPRLDVEQLYASQGYLVWTLDNRGSTGRGHAFEAPLYHNLGGVEVADQRAGVEYLIKQGFVDRNRVGVTGWSYGGYMTVRCLLKAPDVFKVGVAGAPVVDWRNYDTIYTERYMGLPQDNADAYAGSSDVAFASHLQGKLFIQHNFEDDNVLFQNTMQLVNALEGANKQYSMQLYPHKSHGVSGEYRRPLYTAMLEFFNRNLR